MDEEEAINLAIALSLSDATPSTSTSISSQRGVRPSAKLSDQEKARWTTDDALPDFRRVRTGGFSGSSPVISSSNNTASSSVPKRDQLKDGKLLLIYVHTQFPSFKSFTIDLHT